MRLDRVARQVVAMLNDARFGTTVAVWPDGGVSAHRGTELPPRTLPNGDIETPVVTFVSFTEVPSVEVILERLQSCFTA
jgi:hypothetical protein